MTTIEVITKEINAELAKEEVRRALVATTFKGLSELSMRQACIEGMMRGFTFKDFLEKNVYAIPFGSGYSLVTSIDYARKLGMRGGIVGKSAPSFEDGEDGKIVSCSVTVQKKVNDHIGDFTATVYFDEYTTRKGLWLSKPRTMIAKVAEMHALRAACPEDLAQSYVEEEFQKETVVVVAVDVDSWTEKLQAVTTEAELKKVWSSMPIEAKNVLGEAKDALKKRLVKEKTDDNKNISE